MDQMGLQEHTLKPPVIEPRKLPQELCDMILDYVPTEHVAPCTFVCRSWIYKTAPRLLHTFCWPPKSLEEEKEHLKVDSFAHFMKMLAASPRLQCGIRTLRLGPTRHVGYLDKHCIIELSILAAIIDLCPRLDNLTISECCLRPTSVLKDGQCGRIGTLSLVECSTLMYSDTTGIVGALSLFSRIDTLRLGLSGSGVICPPATPLPESLEVGCIESYEPRSYFGFASNPILRHLCAVPGVRASLRKFVSGEPLSLRLMESLQHTPRIEDIAYSVSGASLPPLSRFPALRQVTIHASALHDHAFNWPYAMRDLKHVPPTVRRVAIRLHHHHAASPSDADREGRALAGLSAALLAEDWYPLARFVETQPALDALELRVQCTHHEGPSRWCVERWQDVDPERVREAVSDVVSCQLSKTVARRVVVVPVSR